MVLSEWGPGRGNHGSDQQVRVQCWPEQAEVGLVAPLIILHNHSRPNEKRGSFERTLDKKINKHPSQQDQKQHKLSRVISRLKVMLEKSVVAYTDSGSNKLSLEEMHNPQQRDCAVSSLRCLHRFYSFGPNTFAASVNILDRFLSKVKVQPKYLSCVVGACYFLAGKVHEEDEDNLTATELSQLHRNTWKPSDLKRMEKVILQKLDWDLLKPNCLSFLEQFYEVLCVHQPSMVKDGVFRKLVATFEVCINHSSCSVFKPSTLALSIIQWCLEDCGLITPVIGWCLLQLQGICKLPDSEMFECHTAVSMYVKRYNTQPKKLPQSLPLPKPPTNLKLVTKPSYYGDTDLPTIYEEISTERLNSDEEIQISNSNNFCDSQTSVGSSKNNRWSACILSEKSSTVQNGSMFIHGTCITGKS